MANRSTPASIMPDPSNQSLDQALNVVAAGGRGPLGSAGANGCSPRAGSLAGKPASRRTTDQINWGIMLKSELVQLSVDFLKQYSGIGGTGGLEPPTSAL